MGSRFLIQERPLTVLPTLVKALGFEKAVVLQQIFWLQNQPRSGRILDDGHKWVWGTYEEWCAEFFTFWETRTLRTHIVGLEKMGLLLSCQPKAADWDRTKHYRVDADALDRYIEDTEAVTSMWPDAATSKRSDEDASKRSDAATSNYDSSATSIGTESSTETSPETSTQTTREAPKTTNHTPGEQVDLLTECLAEDPSRDRWFDIAPSRVRALI